MTHTNTPSFIVSTIVVSSFPFQPEQNTHHLLPHVLDRAWWTRCRQVRSWARAGGALVKPKKYFLIFHVSSGAYVRCFDPKTEEKVILVDVCGHGRDEFLQAVDRVQKNAVECTLNEALNAETQIMNGWLLVQYNRRVETPVWCAVLLEAPRHNAIIDVFPCAPNLSRDAVSYSRVCDYCESTD